MGVEFLSQLGRIEPGPDPSGEFRCYVKSIVAAWSLDEQGIYATYTLTWHMAELRLVGCTSRTEKPPTIMKRESMKSARLPVTPTQ